MANGSENGDVLFNSLLGKYHSTIRLFDYSRPTPFSPQKIQSKKIIYLPLPQELRDDSGISYESPNLGTIANILNGNFKGGAAAFALQKAGPALSSTLNSGAGIVGKLSGPAGAIAGAIADAFPAEQVTSAIEQTLGVAPNPNPSVTFQGPQLRDFAFSWIFFPRNRVESRAIFRLVEALKAAALPKNVFSKDGAVLHYPNMAQINFYPWDSKGTSNEWGWTSSSIIRLKKCMMSSVNVSYTPSNTPAFHEGDLNYPVAIQLSIGFKEIEYLLSEDWGGEAGGGGTERDLIGELSTTTKNLTGEAVTAAVT